MKKTCFVYLLLVFCSCSSIYQFSIEVQEPAQVTLPAGIQRIVVVNNSVMQPNTVGIDRIFQEQNVRGMELELDSLAWAVSASLASTLKQTGFFKQASLCLKSPRTDNGFMTAQALPDDFKQEIFEKQGFDGAITIDRVLFNLQEAAKGNPDNGYYVKTKSEAVLTAGIYYHGRNKALTTFAVKDSLTFQTTTSQRDTLSIVKDLPEFILNELAYNLGEKLAQYVVSSWTVKERILYAGQQSRMQEALNFAKSGKWDKARTIWSSEYEQKSKSLDKGKLAGNLAVAEEMQEHLNGALEWAETAKQYFVAANASEDELLRINTYIDDLQQRIQNNCLLDMQWGISPSGF